VAEDAFPLTMIDHVAITVADIDTTARFYTRLFGAEVLRDHMVDGRNIIRALRIGGGVQLSIHQLGNGVDLVAARPTPGSVDICFRIERPIEAAIKLLEGHGVEIVDGPSPRTDNEGRPSTSVYFRDPDGNLVELMATDG
jgi:catechol 2,3-dioxygenase-like lactoylglutathione lyase family enzyme